MKVANTAGALNDSFYPEAVGKLTDANTDPNALPGVSLGVDDLGYIKQGKPANSSEACFEPTQAQLDAMNSGITSAGVEQINTNKNNILSKIGASDYATQNTGGTVRVWTTTDGTDTILHIANEAPTP